ncbi:hypothetical protein BH11MYX2_BH11MYX2_20580 [soil metagenome]
MDARGHAASIACPRCNAEQPPGGDRMRTCASCGLVFDTTKAHTLMDVRTRKRNVNGGVIVLPGVITPLAIIWFLVAVCLFVVGFIGIPDEGSYSRAFWISIGLRAAGLVFFVLALLQTRSVQITITPTELICKRSGRRTFHLSREHLSLDIDTMNGEPTWRPMFALVAMVGDRKILLAVRVSADEARAQLDAINEGILRATG